MRFPKVKHIYLLILLPAVYFAIFLHLDSLSFRVWDESFLAMNTYEMMADHDYIVTHSLGLPEVCFTRPSQILSRIRSGERPADMYFTKPPLVIWFMVLSSKIFGFSELSVRLPNALAGTAICFLLFFFASRVLGSPLTGFLSVLILISSTGFTALHIVRSGEDDAFLMFFIFIYCLSFFMLLEDIGSKRWYWFVFTIAVICAVLSKGIAGILAFPGLCIYALARGKAWGLIKSKETYTSIFFIFLFGLGYYFLREHFNPGYLRAVNENELGGRYIQTNEGHSGGFFFYWDLICGDQFLFVLPFIFFGAFRAFSRTGRGILEHMIVFSVYVLIPYVLVLSASATKLSWYLAPTAPIIALIAGYGLATAIEFLLGVMKNSSGVGKTTLMVLVIAVIIGPAYRETIKRDQCMTEAPWDKEYYSIPDYIKKKESQGGNVNGYKIIYDPYILRTQMCQIREMQDRGQKLQIVGVSGLKEGDTVITRDADTRKQISKRYSHILADASDNVEVWKLTAKNESGLAQ